MLYISRGYLHLTILALLLISLASALLNTYTPLPRPLLTTLIRLYHVHSSLTETTISELGNYNHLTILALLIYLASALLNTYTPLPRPLLTTLIRLYHVHSSLTETTISELGNYNHFTILALLISLASALLNTQVLFSHLQVPHFQVPWVYKVPFCSPNYSVYTVPPPLKT